MNKEFHLFCAGSDFQDATQVARMILDDRISVGPRHESRAEADRWAKSLSATGCYRAFHMKATKRVGTDGYMYDYSPLPG